MLLIIIPIHAYTYLLVLYSRNPLEVSEDFIRQYNNAQNYDDREKYETTAHKMLERSKVGDRYHS